MVFTLAQIAAQRGFCPVRFTSFAFRPENVQFLNDDDTVSSYNVDTLIDRYRNATPSDWLAEDRLNIEQGVNDRR